jgi:hypothetical protein
MIMNARSNTTEQMLNVVAIGIWENEGGASGRDALDEQYGRRIETDRSWTVYHVFTGVPAHADGETLTGLSRLKATDRMLSLNRNGRHIDRGSLTQRTWPARSIPEDCLP